MRARLSFEIAIRSTAPLRTLSADECMQTPAVHMAMTPDRFDEAVQELHVHSRRYCGVYSKHRLIESSIGPEVCMSEEMVIHAMDNAAAIGAELFFIDAGWYSPDGGESDWPAFTGDWDPIHWRYQRSMLDFRQYAHDKGMLFGLWMDVEKIGWQSRTMQNPSVPQLQGYAGRTMDAKSGVLDVADPAGAEWAYQQIRSVIERYQLDFFRLDSGAYAYWSQGIVDGRHENRDLRYYEHFYSIFERLRREFPKVIFQNCAGGGSRIDLGMLRPMSNTWVTDNQVAPLSFSVLNGVSLCVPPDYMVRTIGAQGGHMAGTLAFQLNVVRFGIPNYCYVPPVSVDLSPDQLDHVRRMLDTYKTYIRPMLPTSRIYHHTPVLQYEQPGCFGVLELAAEDGSCSLLSAFTLSEVTEPVHTVRFKGLCAHLDYDIWVDDRFWCTLPGSRLMMDGLPVEIPGALDSKAFLAVAHKDDLRPLSI